MKKLFLSLLAPLSVLMIGYLTYFNDYSYPSSLFWDENYHIASAEKYIQGVFFMEPHPPLGKLFIALGEKIINPNQNIDKSEFVRTDYIKKVPTGYSFEGVRFFPALFGMLGAILIYYIFYLLSGKQYISLLFSGLYLFENGMITQSRSAMLDSIQIFFLLVPILHFIYVLQKKNTISMKDYLINGLLVGIGVSVKLNSAILCVLPIFLAFYEMFFNKNSLFKIRNFIKYFLKALVFGSGILITFLGVWYIHIAIGTKVVDSKFYQASSFYKQVIGEGKTGNLLYFSYLIQDHMDYISHYQQGVPSLDVCKKGENGSYPLHWIVGGKTINYRREALSGFKKIRYMYFVGNPVIWWSVFVSILMIFSLVVGNIFFGLKIKDKKLYFYMLTFFVMYIGYMIVMMQITRVMYIYHYLLPLMFGIIMIFLVYMYVFDPNMDQDGQYKFWKISLKKLEFNWTMLIIYFLALFICYMYFSPFSYYLPLTKQQFQLRSWFDFRQMKPIN